MQWRNNCMVTWGVSRPLMMHSFLGGETKEETCWCLQVQAFNQDASVAHDSYTFFDTKYQIVALQHDTTSGLYPFLGFNPWPAQCRKQLKYYRYFAQRRYIQTRRDQSEGRPRRQLTSTNTITAWPWRRRTHVQRHRSRRWRTLLFQEIITVSP